jgi:hypothetical protein
MANESLIIRCKLEEVSPIAKLIIKQFTLDQPVIVKVFPNYNPASVAALEAKFTKVDALINPSLLIGKISQATQSINSESEALLPQLFIFEGYLNRAKNLSVEPKYFGITLIRKAINAENVEGVIDGLDTFIKAIADGTNQAKLIAEGMTAQQIAYLSTTKTSLLNKKTDRILLNSQKESLVKDNYVLINSLWADLTDICDVGKRVFKNTDAIKVKSYTMTNILGEVRRQVNLNGFKGIVSFEDVNLNGASIELLPLEAGRRRTTKSKKGGTFLIPRITPGSYILNVSLKGYEKFSINIEIENGNFLAQNIQLVPLAKTATS